MDREECLPVYKAWVDLFSDEVARQLDGSLSPEAKGSILRSLQQRILTLSLPILEEYIRDQIKKENPFWVVLPDLISEENKKACIKAAAESLQKAGTGAFDGEAPTLKEKLLRTCEFFVSFVNEMVDRIGQNKNGISASLLDSPFHEIRGFTCNGADVHNHGRSSVTVETDAGKFLYKPRDCSTDVAFREICSRFFGGSFKAPKVLYISAEYSFCEYITNSPATDPECARQYYSNLGGLCALLTVLGGTDLHEENILANNTIPIPVDLETVFMSSKVPGRPTTAEEDFCFSAFKTSMFSVRGMIAGSRETSPLFDLSDRNAAAPVTDGRRRSVYPYREAFKNGFSLAYRRCLEVRDGILDIIEAKAIRTRILLRNTNYYALMTDKLNARKFGSDRQTVDAVRSELELYYPPEIAKKESSDLGNGDIPYFYLHTDSRDLYSYDGFQYKDFLVMTPMEAIRTSFEIRNGKELDFELNVIDSLISNAISDENNGQHTVFASTDPLERAAEIYNAVVASLSESPCGHCYTVEIRNQAYPSITGYDLAFGKTGIALFAAALSCVTEDPSLKKHSRELSVRLIGEVGAELSAINSRTGYVASMKQHKGMKRAYELISLYIGIEQAPYGLPEQEIENEMTFESGSVFRDSLLGGNAGTADALIEQYLKTGEEEQLEKAKAILLRKDHYQFCSDHSPVLFSSGFCYGASGVGYELLRLTAPDTVKSIFRNP